MVENASHSPSTAAPGHNLLSEAKAREAVADRSTGWCEMGCGQRACNVHHRQNRSQGGVWRLSNVLHLCGSGTTGCHGRIGAAPAWAYAEGLLVPALQDPATVPVRLRHLVYLAWWFDLHDDGLWFAAPYDTPTEQMTGLTGAIT